MIDDKDTDMDSQHTSFALELAYDLGYKAYLANHDHRGRVVEDNPYTAVGQEDLYDAWENGYSAAGWDD